MNRFADDFKGNRYKTLKTAFLFAGILEELSLAGINDGWTSAKDLARWYRESVGPISDRSALRYGYSLEAVGVAELRKVLRYRGWRVEFRFVDYPVPGGLTL